MKTRTMVPLILLFALVLIPATTFFGLTTEQVPRVQKQVELKKLPSLPPTITSVEGRYLVEPMPLIKLSGTGFGDHQGERNIMVDGVLGTSLGIQNLNWSNKQAEFEFGGLVPWYHEYTIGLVNGEGKIISNQVKFRFPVAISRASNQFGAAGAEVQLTVMGIPQQGPRSLKIGDLNLQVLQWTGSAWGGAVRARIPAIAPGNYLISVWDGGEKISKDFNFQVR